MATETTYPGASAVEPGIGGSCTAVSVGSPGGSCDCDGISACPCCGSCSLSQQSLRFSSWDNPIHDGDYTAIHLNFDWSVSGGGSECTTANVYAQYSTNNGSAWTNATGFPKVVSGGASGSVNQSIPNPSPWVHGQFLVRVWAEANCATIACSSEGCDPPCAGAECTATLEVDNLRLVGTYPSGACCLTCGTCQTGKSPSTCSGTFQGDGTDCSPNPCTQPTGACCDGGSCTETTQVACAHTWQGCGTDCLPNPCAQPTGSCCDDVTGECTETTDAACTGTWTESGTCTPNPCSTGGGLCYSFGM